MNALKAKILGKKYVNSLNSKTQSEPDSPKHHPHSKLDPKFLKNNRNIDLGIADGSFQIKDWANKVSDMVEYGDVAAKLRPKFNINQADDGIKFKKFMYEQVDRFLHKKFVVNQMCKF